MFCGCGYRLIPEKRAGAAQSLPAPPQDDRLAQAMAANKNLLAMLYEARTTVNALNLTNSLLTKDRDDAKAELAAMRAALVHSGLPEPQVETK